MSMRVAILWMARGGSVGSGNTNHIRHWALGLKDYDMELYLLACYEPWARVISYYAETPNIHLIHLPALASQQLLYIPAIHSLLQFVYRERIDILHTIGLHADLVGALAKRFSHNISMLSSVEGYLTGYQTATWKHKAYRFLYRRVSSSFDAVSAITEKTKQELVQGFGLPHEIIHVIHSGVDPRAFVWKDKASTRVGDKKLHVGFLGRLSPEKGGDVFLQMSQIINSELPDAMFSIAGDGVSRDAMVAMSGSLNIADVVVFEGWCRNPSTFLTQLDILVVPSMLVSEGLPWTVLESLAVGTPVVATRSGGVEEVIINGETGILVDEQNPLMLAQAVIGLWRDRDLSHSIAIKGRKRIEEHFNMNREASELFSLYEQLRGLS